MRKLMTIVCLLGSLIFSARTYASYELYLIIDNLPGELLITNNVDRVATNYLSEVCTTNVVGGITNVTCGTVTNSVWVESTNTVNAVNCESFSWGVSNAPPDWANGETTGGPTQFAPFTITYLLEKVSPELYLATTSGTPIGTVTVVLRYPTGGRDNMIRYKLNNVTVQAVQSAGQPKEFYAKSLETVALDYGSVEITYFRYDNMGKFLGTVTTSWDRGGH